MSYIRQLISLYRYLEPAAVQVDFRVLRPLVARVIPPFIFSTVLENAYKYGDPYDAEQPIRLVLESTADRLVLMVTNKVRLNAPVLHEGARVSTGIGLINVRKQLDLLHPGGYEFQAGRHEEMCRVRLVIYFNQPKNKDSIINESKEESDDE